MKNKKRIFGIVVPLLLVAFVWFEWDSWFTMPPEPVYSASAEPHRIMLSWSGDALTTRDVTWECDTLAKTGQLQLVPVATGKDTVVFAAAAKIVKSAGGASAFFKVLMKDLKPGDSYNYRVGNEKRWSEWNKFRLPGSSDSSFTSVFMGDVQDTLHGVSEKIFHRAYAAAPNTAMMIFIGDMIERPHDAYWQQFIGAGGTIFSSVPVIATPGNHEYYKGLFPKIDERWMEHFSFPQNGPPDFLGRVCYWDYLNTRFISLDSNGINSVPEAFEQRNWLKSVLEKTHQRWIVLMIHHPFYSTTPGRNNIHLRWLFKSLLDKYHVDLVLQGHDHSYGRAAHISSSDPGNSRGPIYVESHASPKLYEINFSDKMDKLASNTQMYQLLDFSKDSLRFRAFTFEGSYFDGFTLKKDASGNTTFFDHAPANEARYLKPTRKKLLKSSAKEREDEDKQAAEWLRSKNR